MLGVQTLTTTPTLTEKVGETFLIGQTPEMRVEIFTASAKIVVSNQI